MIYPEVTLKEWTKKYKLQTELKACASCGKVFATTVFHGGFDAIIEWLDDEVVALGGESINEKTTGKEKQ